MLASESAVLRSFEPLLRGKVDALRIRVHGRLHLGHVLHTGGRFVLTDMGGPRDQPLSERRRKRSPLRDVASMVRSFESAATKALLDSAIVRDTDRDLARPWALHWASWVSASFLGAYLDGVAPAGIVPRDRGEAAVLFDAFWIERALHQLHAQLEEPVQDAAVLLQLTGLEHTLTALR